MEKSFSSDVSSLYGLSSTQVEESRQQHGENVLTPPRRRSMWRLYLEKYEDPIIRILLVAAVVSLGMAFFSGEYVETVGIIVAVFFATTVGFYFERDAARRFQLLTQVDEEQQVKVFRDGRVTAVPRREVVVGDVVIVETGDEVPADGTLLEATDLQVDESSLTGESITTKQTEPSSDSTSTAYSCDMLLRSSMVMSGSGRFVVTAVGDATEIGRVARQATELTAVKTPLNMQLDRLARLISKVGTAVSCLAFVTFLVHDILTDDLWHTTDYLGMAEVVLRYFMMAVTLIVMAVPEGLPMAVTLALALNMRRMLKSNNLVRKLHACETMGAVNVICTDKTGTLTQNRMTVMEVMTEYGTDMESFMEQVACNTTADLDGDSGIGNPTEVALLRWLRQQGTDYRLLRSADRIVSRQPFSTERKYMETVIGRGGGRLRFVKGAPEVVLGMCDISDKERVRAEEVLLGYQQKAMRTLAFAAAGNDGALRLQALCAISDPLRPDVPKAVADCQRAGIEVKVVTGDNEATAREIAREIGILAEATGMPYTEMSGAAFAALSDEEALRAAPLLRVMSRARPADKQRLVDMLQRQGMVVAVTGDGTNDAPALNYAHVGLSLGSGTSVAKEASDITIIDDSFRSIVRAVEWGRSLYRNIQRFIFFQLVVNVTALLLVLGGSVIGTELPLTVTQILWVNLIMDTFAAMALASLPPSHEVMNVPPRTRQEFIITRSMMWAIAGWGLLFFLLTFVCLCWMEAHDGVEDKELTRFFTLFVMLQWWNLFNAKSLFSSHSAFRHLFRGRGFVLVLLMILAGQWLIVQFGGDMFRTVPLDFHDWLVLFVITSPVLWLGELYRLWKRQ